MTRSTLHSSPPCYQSGYTLIETLLYVSMISIIIFTIVAWLMVELEARVKQQTIAEIEQSGTQVMQTTTQLIRNAETINSPATGASSSTLSLDVVDAAKDPTIIELSGGVIYITEGAGSAVPLTAAPVNVDSLTFYNLSRSGTPGVVRLQFTLTYTNPSGRQEYDYTKTFYGSASVR